MNTVIVLEALKLERKIIEETKKARFKYLAMKIKENGHVAYKQINSEVAIKILREEGYIIYNMSEFR